MKRFLAVVAVFSIVVSACSGSDEIIASVNGENVTRSQVEVLVPDTDDPSATTDFPRYLSVVIQWEAISQAAAAEGIEPTEDEVDARLDELVANQGEGATLEEYLNQVQASEEGIRQFTKQLIIQDAIQANLSDGESVSDDDVNSELANNRLDWTVVCALHILVLTEEEAIATQERLDAGDDFAVVAQEVSIDTASGANGGDLGCASPSDYVESFAAATLAADIDVVTEPVETEFGFHLILVTQREEATPEVVRVAMERDALAIAVDGWFKDVIESADVTVDEEIGVWVTDPTPQILTVN
jgi:foldase protein PrsA